MCISDIIKFIADYDQSVEYSKTSEYLSNDFEDFFENLLSAMQNKFYKFYIEGASKTCIVAKINGKIFNCNLIYNSFNNKYYWNVDLEEDD